MQIEFEGIKGLPVEDDSEVRHDGDDKEQEQNEQVTTELSWPAVSQNSPVAGCGAHVAS